MLWTTLLQWLRQPLVFPQNVGGGLLSTANANVEPFDTSETAQPVVQGPSDSTMHDAATATERPASFRSGGLEASALEVVNM